MVLVILFKKFFLTLISFLLIILIIMYLYTYIRILNFMIIFLGTANVIVYFVCFFLFRDILILMCGCSTLFYDLEKKGWNYMHKPVDIDRVDSIQTWNHLFDLYKKVWYKRFYSYRIVEPLIRAKKSFKLKLQGPNLYSFIRTFVEILILLTCVPFKILTTFYYFTWILSNIFLVSKEVKKLATFELVGSHSIFSLVLPRGVYTLILEKKVDLFLADSLSEKLSAHEKFSWPRFTSLPLSIYLYFIFEVLISTYGIAFRRAASIVAITSSLWCRYEIVYNFKFKDLDPFIITERDNIKDVNYELKDNNKWVLGRFIRLIFYLILEHVSTVLSFYIKLSKSVDSTVPFNNDDHSFHLGTPFSVNYTHKIRDCFMFMAVTLFSLGRYKSFINIFWTVNIRYAEELRDVPIPITITKDKLNRFYVLFPQAFNGWPGYYPHAYHSVKASDYFCTLINLLLSNWWKGSRHS